MSYNIQDCMGFNNSGDIGERATYFDSVKISRRRSDPSRTLILAICMEFYYAITRESFLLLSSIMIFVIFHTAHKKGERKI